MEWNPSATKDKREKYGVATLAPILELMVSDILRELPADPKAFMKQWLDKPPTDGKCYSDVLRDQMQQMQASSADGMIEAFAAMGEAKPEVQIAARHIVDKSILEGCRMEGERAFAEAPFIHQFFKVVGGIAGEVMMADEYEAYFEGKKGMTEKDLQNMMRAWQQKNVIAKMERIQTEGVPLLTKSFQHHDSDSDNVLNRDEAAKFFAHVVAEEGPFLEMVISACNVKMWNMMRMVGEDEFMSHGGDDQDMQNFQEKVEKMKAAYLANKADRDLAAFMVCDTNGDGTLQLDEVVAALMPGGNKNDAFIAALGFESMGQRMLTQMSKFECD